MTTYGFVFLSCRRKLLTHAENSAIDCFAKNLRELLLTAPLKGYAVLAIDPGYSNGCKCALLNENGDFYQQASTIRRYLYEVF